MFDRVYAGLKIIIIIFIKEVFSPRLVHLREGLKMCRTLWFTHRTLASRSPVSSYIDLTGQ